MRQVFCHYRQISIIDPRNADQPQITGREEIWCNGNREVRYWNDPDYLMLSLRKDFLFDLVNHPWMRLDSIFFDESWPAIESNDRKHSPRYINPDEVIIQATNQSSHPLSWRQKIADLPTTFSQGIKKVKTMAKKLPCVLKSAWQELNQTD
ncbi:hypothetical protein PCC8801_2021 [Rippkaea orientalis PCC 8801]|uniref:Uncharacterized protein n=1 Tax=Rippkaea orientalis (strain PCC 8801 / RF-1) TaxID=41431 RepID=B7JYX9_RIPO1|nr:hypothetical protein [Rippkaea orientalis]ACK66056.1 hypothetical protein PCC8801_2021 [Rippkaea orientalis PCC 8801]